MFHIFLCILWLNASVSVHIYISKNTINDYWLRFNRQRVTAQRYVKAIFAVVKNCEQLHRWEYIILQKWLVTAEKYERGNTGNIDCGNKRVIYVYRSHTSRATVYGNHLNNLGNDIFGKWICHTLNSPTTTSVSADVCQGTSYVTLRQKSIPPRKESNSITGWNLMRAHSEIFCW